MYRRAAIYPETVRQHSPPAYHPHTCRLILQHLPKALLLALLVGTPVMGQEAFYLPPLGQQALWEEFRDVYLGRNRSDLMEFCASGRKINKYGGYYFDPRTQKKKLELALSKGLSKKMADAMLSGTAAAMAIACPEVR